mmetsp:Transcript_73912/g.167510  ORF Transcript_73912/g.167510 Transcript_73912/m.167510 type:complete len:717 (-) Transcript_73912:76-2226(-)
MAMPRGLLAAAALCFVPFADASVVPEGFQAQLRCPFAKVWIEHGPDRAAEILGVTPHRRLADVTVWGKCTYTNPFAGTETCMELHGATWTDATAKTRCDNAMQGTAGTLGKGARCTTTADLAGWCSTASGAEMTPMATTSSTQMDTCAKVAQSCTQWSQGTFMMAGKCQQTQGNQQPTDTNNGPPPGVSGGTGRCSIAPGPIGAAHQLAQSPGYDSNCAGTPAQQSPYMWPLKWGANVQSKALGFGSDAITYESRGRVWYMLDKNWKRMDTWYQRGVQRSVGQGPCENPVDGVTFGCQRDSDRNQTMLHRGHKMVFIDWATDGTIANCSWLDMSVIGNIRPDWFMDNRGASTDVQYLGDSHVYYMNEPRLVKQWRKKDFASQYFTMSMQAIVGSDNVHWPLILNVPGEGFGDDFLQYWDQHRTLTAADESLFLLDEELESNGGSCPQRQSSGTDGPPTGTAAHVPSNLEVQAESWRSIVYTASPVWKPPAEKNIDESSGRKEVEKGVFVEACFDEATKNVAMSLSMDVSKAVWASVGFRDTSECLMTPRGGGDGEVVYAKPDEQGTYTMHHGPLGANLKSFSSTAMSSFEASLSPFAEVQDMKGGGAEFSNGKLTVHFMRAYASKPAMLNLSFAYGNTKEVGYHTSRGCFEMTDLRPCPTYACPRCPVCKFDNMDTSKNPQEPAPQELAGTVRTPPGIALLAAILVASFAGLLPGP